MLKPVLAALAAFAILSQPALAEDHPYRANEVLAQERVSYADLDLGTEVGAKTLMKRIYEAARTVCKVHGVSMIYAQRQERACRATAVRTAVAQIDAPTLWAAYQGRRG